MTRIVGLVSTWQEGELAVSAVRSLLAVCDVVRVLDGPVGAGSAAGPSSDWSWCRRDHRVLVTHAESDSDAEKRTWILKAAQNLAQWGIVLDGDELLVNGEQMRPMIAHANEVERTTGELQYGISLRIIEADGSCSCIPARVLRIDRIERYLISSYHMLLTNGVEVSKPNVPLLLAGEPDSAAINTSTGMQKRRPLPGEPCILHRTHLRSPERQAQRQNVAEAERFAEIDQFGLRHETPKDDGVKLWLPE